MGYIPEICRLAPFRSWRFLPECSAQKKWPSMAVTSSVPALRRGSLMAVGCHRQRNLGVRFRRRQFHRQQLPECLPAQELVLDGAVVESEGDALAFFAGERTESAAGVVNRNVQHGMVTPFQKGNA